MLSWTAQNNCHHHLLSAHHFSWFLMLGHWLESFTGALGSRLRHHNFHHFPTKLYQLWPLIVTMLIMTSRGDLKPLWKYSRWGATTFPDAVQACWKTPPQEGDQPSNQPKSILCLLVDVTQVMVRVITICDQSQSGQFQACSAFLLLSIFWREWSWSLRFTRNSGWTVAPTACTAEPPLFPTTPWSSWKVLALSSQR